ncbi:MAG: AAA family ATPase [Bacteroidia bacterium]|nr:AAA family ATPase [Bacteroidia bacterium]
MQNVNNAYSNAAIPYIPVNRGYGADLVSNYSAYIQQHTTLKRQLKKDLEILIPQLESFEPSEITQPATIIFFLRDSEGSVALPMMGEGAIKLFRILSEILTWKGQRLMIDEIDTGFHHSRMRPFWKTILNAAQRHETQLFVTTHNLECIQHLRDTLREDMPDFKDEVRVIRLAKVLAGTKAYTYTYPEFESALENENELR